LREVDGNIRWDTYAHDKLYTSYQPQSKPAFPFSFSVFLIILYGIGNARKKNEKKYVPFWHGGFFHFRMVACEKCQKPPVV
jgi:hypothetical protein